MYSVSAWCGRLAAVARAPARRSRGRVVRPRSAEARDVRAAILDAAEQLLADRRFDELAVAEILEAAQASRASFYFYFENKHAVLAELVRRAVGAGLQAAEPWVDRAAGVPPRASLRQGTQAGVRLWRDKAPVLRAIVENWRTDEALSELWTELMQSFTDAAVERIERDRQAGLTPQTTLDTRLIASALTWLGERLYYLAAIGIPPFDDDQRLVDALTEIWSATVYGGTGDVENLPSSE